MWLGAVDSYSTASVDHSRKVTIFLLNQLQKVEKLLHAQVLQEIKERKSSKNTRFLIVLNQFYFTNLKSVHHPSFYNL